MKTAMMGKQILLVVLLMTIFITSCKKNEEKSEQKLQSQEILNQSYGASVSNTVDVYLPTGRDENTQVVILVHGGSWIGGDKSEFSEYASLLSKKGFAVVNMNYRLVNTAGTVRLSDQQNDIKAVVEYAYAKSSEWKVSNKIGLLGASAGAHLSLLYTYANNADNKVKTVIALAAPANLTDTRNINMQLVGVAEALLGKTLNGNYQSFVDASPISKVIASSKPTLVFHGKLDQLVPVQQAVDLKAKLDQVQVKSKLVVYETTGHEVLNAENTVAFFAEVEAWLKVNIN